MFHSPETRSPNSGSLLGNYWQFLRSPVLTASSEVTPVRQIQSQILRLYSLHLLVVLILGVLISQVIGRQDNLLPELFAEIPVWVLFGMAVVAAPLIEESLFRLPLRLSAFNIMLPSSLVVWFGISFLSRFNHALILSTTAILIALNLYLLSAKPRVPALQQFYVRYPRLIFYCLTLLFGAIHITNYVVQVWWLLPILVLPQVIIGLWLGFIRLRYGFGWAIVAHGFHNGCLLVPILLIGVLGSPQLQTQGLENVDAAGLSPLDQLLVLGTGIYSAGGIILCAVVAWKVLREWIRKR